MSDALLAVPARSLACPLLEATLSEQGVRGYLA